MENHTVNPLIFWCCCTILILILVEVDRLEYNVNTISLVVGITVHLNSGV